MASRPATYPRAQRMAICLLLVFAVGGLWLAERVAARSADTSPALRNGAERLRATLAAEEAKSFRPPPEAFAFDPNVVTAEELKRLGLSEKQAAGWLRFRGTRTNAFRQPEDIGKLYVLTEEDKARLIPLAYVTDTKTDKGARPQVQGFGFDPNTVDTDELQALGLSPKQAAAFINYRTASKYGRAFRKPEDLRRVKTMSDTQRDHLVRWAEIPSEEAGPITAAHRFRFDPNVISADSLQLLGFPAWQAKSFVTYRGERANTFRRAEDLRRVGALDSALVESVLGLVDLAPFPNSFAPATAPQTYDYVPKAPPPALASFDVNAADTTAWRALPGIGRYRAKSIVRFRDLLGGFVSLEQIATTRGLPDSTFLAILPYLNLNTPIRPIAINRVTYEELIRHPYLKRNLANSIVKNRDKFGRFNSPKDLRRLRLITDEKLEQLTPYFSFE